jgi:hypothetical protein
LRWEAAEDIDLDLTLFQTGERTPIVKSAGIGAQVEQLRGDVAGGATYELRVTLRAGTGAAVYTLDFSQPN